MEQYKDIINRICSMIHTGLIDFDEPRSEASMPTQASSEFITNKQQGDWAEDVIFRAINDNSENIVAVRYGKSDDLVAGDAGFENFFNDYQAELDAIGKRPDILLFKKSDFDVSLGYDISFKPSCEIGDYVAKAIAGIEVRSSAFLINKYTAEANRVVRENTERAIELKSVILNEYVDLLEQKRPELISILQQLDEVSVRTIDFRATAWRSSQRNLSVIQMCLREANAVDDISRNQRTIIWLYKMLWDFTQFGKFNYTDIVNDLAYNYKTDKAFAISGKLTNPLMRCDELTKPRISKYDIKNIILGDGQKFLRPERRFDAYLVSHPELFVK
ncbi:MAG: AccI family restriction endonuclease [Bacteroidales bacterium]|nr:AccI family restriction endonuclease [Bacteroidales bacterium]